MSKPTRSVDIPQPRSRPLVGNMPDIGFETPMQNLMKLAREHGPLFRLAFPGGRSALVLSSHALVADACDETRFEKKVGAALEHIRDFAGDGLFTAYTEEPNWGKAHRLLMPAFGPAAMQPEPLITPSDVFLDLLSPVLNMSRGRRIAFHLTSEYGISPADALAESLVPHVSTDVLARNVLA